MLRIIPIIAIIQEHQDKNGGSFLNLSEERRDKKKSKN